MGSVGRDNLDGLSAGVYGSGGAPWHHLALLASCGAQVSVVRAGDIEAGMLDSLDVLVVPGGGATATAGMLEPLGKRGASAIRSWVQAGGTYVGSCAGSVLPLGLDGEASSANPLASCMTMVDARLANSGGATLGGLASPGVGTIRVRLEPGHPFNAGLPETIDIVHYNGPLFDVTGAGESLEAFAWPESATEAFTPAEGFLPNDSPGSGALVLDACIAAGAATGLVARHGSGRVILFGSHPEFGLGPIGLGWGDPAQLLINALASITPRRAASSPDWAVQASMPQDTPERLARAAAAALSFAAARFNRLAYEVPERWLEPAHAPSFHGLSGARIWQRDAQAAAAAAETAANSLVALAPHLTEDSLPWLDDEPRSGQDFGAMGLLQLVTRVHEFLDSAQETATLPPRTPAHAYDLFDRHPYHLSTASYLSAAGLVAGCTLLVALLHYQAGQSNADLDRLLWRQAND